MIPQERIEDIRSRYRVSDVARRLTKLKKSGGEYSGLCPFHGEKTPSFTVNDAKGFYHCFGCGAHGDVIRLAQNGFNLGFPEAVEMIDGRLPEIDPTQWATEREEDRVRDIRNAEAAERFWDSASFVAGTAADKYLASRMIYVRPDNLRFGRVPSWFNEERGEWGPPKPALLIRAENLDGSFAGIQRIFLTEGGGKAAMPNPKLSLGNIRGASIRFGKPSCDAILTGGPEDGLTLFQRYGEQVTVYVSCGEAMLHLARLPSLVRSITIARQNDAPGLAASKRTEAVLREQGRIVRNIAPPKAFKDWNDELCKRHAIEAGTVTTTKIGVMRSTKARSA